MDTWQVNLKHAFISLLGRAAHEFAQRKVRLIDIGVFPWHASIELSFLFDGDDYAADDIAAWPYYNYSNVNEGGWPEVQTVLKDLNAIWMQSRDMEAILHKLVAVACDDDVKTAIKGLTLAADYQVQVLNPDVADSRNYMPQEFSADA